MEFKNNPNVTPQQILDMVKNDLKRLKSIFIVGIEYTGEPRTYMAGSMGDLSFANLALQNLALTCLNANVPKEGGH